jgi:hypothetical protein
MFVAHSYKNSGQESICLKIFETKLMITSIGKNDLYKKKKILVYKEEKFFIDNFSS